MSNRDLKTLNGEPISFFDIPAIDSMLLDSRIADDSIDEFVKHPVVNQKDSIN